MSFLGVSDSLVFRHLPRRGGIRRFTRLGINTEIFSTAIRTSLAHIILFTVSAVSAGDALNFGLRGALVSVKHYHVNVDILLRALITLCLVLFSLIDNRKTFLSDEGRKLVI